MVARHAIRRDRSAFTLIEVLMVILLIAILVGLLVPVIASAYRKGREAAEITEINSLVTMLERFKDRYGVYPPSQIILREDGDYSWDGSGSVRPFHNDQPTSGAGGVFVRDLSIQYLKRIWPQIQLNTSTIQGNSAYVRDKDGSGGINQPDEFFDWNGNGLFDDNVTYYLSGDECLAFFLGGIPTGEPRDNPGVRQGQGPPGTNGFSKDPLNPTIPPIAGTATVSRDEVFYQFDGNRLVDGDQNGFYEFMPLRRPGITGGYAYFSSYEGVGYRPDDMNIDTTAVSTELEPNGDNSIPSIGSTYMVFRVLWPVTTTGSGFNSYPTAFRYSETGVTVMTSIQSPGPNPYTFGFPYEPQSVGVAPKVRYVKPDSFQLFSPSSDNAYGQGGALPRYGPTVTKAYYKEATADKDNVSSFSAGELKDAGSN